MDVELPDGTIIEGVPEGTTKSQLMAKLKAGGYDVSKLMPSKPADESGKFRFASPETEKAGLGLIGRATEAAVKYLGEPLEAAAAKTAPTAYANRVLGNVPQDVMGISQGFTPEAMGALGSAMYNQPLQTTADIGSAALQGVGGFLADPLGTFERAPVSTAMGLQAAQMARMPGRVAANMAAEAIYPKAREFLQPKNRMLYDVFGQPEIQAAIQEAPPGMSVPQALADINAPVAQAVARQAMELVPEQTRAARMAQEEARMSRLRGAAGTPEDLEALEAERGATAKTNYSRAFKQAMKETPELTDIMGRPSMEKAFSRAAQIAEERGKAFQIGKTTPETIAESKILDEFGRPVQKVTPAEIAKYPVQSLHYVKMALDDMVRDPKDFGIGATEVSAIRETRKEFIKQLENNEAYATARAEYAAQSEPINRAQVLQQLVKAGTEPVSEGLTRAGMFARAVEEAPKTIKKATGQQYFKKLEDVLEPEDMEIVNDIRDEFRRTKLADEQARLGAAVAPEVGELASAKVTSAMNIPFLNRNWTIANTIVKRTLGRVDTKLATEIGMMMQDRGEFLAALREAKKYAAATQKTTEKLKARRQKITQGTRTSPVTRPVSIVGSVQNAMSPENRNAMAR